MTHSLYAGVALALLASSAAFARDEPRAESETEAQADEILVIGAREPVPLDRVTSAATIIGPEEIAARADVFVGDLLRGAPSASVSQSGPFGALTQLRLRGAEANQTLVLIDGVEAASPFTGEFEFANLQTANIARIEVLRGEQSALWGADAIGGVVNIVTRDGGDRLAASARLEGGSYGTARGSARIAGPIAAGTASLSIAGYETDGIDVSGSGGETDGYDNVTLSASLGYPVAGDSARLRVDARYQDAGSDSDPDIDFDGDLDDADRRRETEELYARAALSGAPGGGLHYEASAALSLIEAGNFADGAFSNASLGRRWDFEGEIGWRGEAFGAEHRLIGLVESETEQFKNDGGSPGAGENQSRSLTNEAAALDFGLTAGPATFTASARRDFNSRFEDATTWRVGAAYAFESIGGRLRGSLGEGVANPGAFELFGFFPDFFVGNPDLRPERSKGWEIGWDQTFDSAGLDLSATWFDSELQDEIYTDFSAFPATARNRAFESARRGLELEAAWRASETLRLDASASFLDAEENDEPEIRRPDTTASLAVSWAPDGPWRLGASADYVGERLDTDFATFETAELDPYVLVGAVVGYAFAEGWEATLRGENLLDEDYVDVIGFETPGAAVYAGLSWSR